MVSISLINVFYLIWDISCKMSNLFLQYDSLLPLIWAVMRKIAFSQTENWLLKMEFNF